MSLLQLTRVSVGEVGVKPGDVKMITTDNFATITAAGYLNGVGSQLPEVGLAPSDVVECLYSYNAYTDTGSLAYFQPVISNGVITLTAVGNPGDVTLPVVSGNFSVFSGTTGLMHDAGFSPTDPAKTKVVMAGSAVQVGYIPHFVDTAGTIDDTAGTIQNDGIIQSGKSGTVGGFIAYPPTAANGFLELLAINAGGAFNTIISNSAMLQTSTISIPDPGAATAKFLLSALTGAGTQHITSGALQVDAGAISSGLATGGFVGTLVAYPTTASKGSLALTALVNATGNFSTTISNALAVAQSQVITIPDSGAAAANFLLSSLTGAGVQHITSGGLQVDGGSLLAGLAAGGTAGSLTLYPPTTANGFLELLAVNAGGAFNTIISNGVMGQTTTYTIPDILASTGGIVVSTSAVRMKSVAGAAAAGGAAAQSFTDAFCTTGSNVVGNWNTQANAASVLKIVPGNGSFVVTSSADAGVGTFNYIITK